MFVLDISRLEDGPIKLRKELPLPWLSGELDACEYDAVPERGSLDLAAETSGNGVLLRGEVRAEVQVECGTCLAKTGLQIGAELATYLLPRPEQVEMDADQELTPEDLDREYYDGEKIRLDDLIRDAIMLELPMNPRCGDGCPGMPELAGAARAQQGVDPRLAPLASVKTAKED